MLTVVVPIVAGPVKVILEEVEPPLVAMPAELVSKYLSFEVKVIEETPLASLSKTTTK
jgi:hypothetical protein